MKKILLFFTLLFVLTSTPVSAHLFHLSSVNTDLEIQGNMLKTHTTVNLPYTLDEIETEEELQEVLQNTTEYIGESFSVANNGTLCNFWDISVYPDEESAFSTFIDGKFICSDEIKNTSDLVIKSSLFQDVSSDSWTHFLFVKNGETKEDIILSMNENVYPNTQEAKDLSKDWGPVYEVPINDSETTEKSKFQEEKIIDNNKKSSFGNIFKIIQQFVVIGVEHIIFGFDHILFVVVLVLLITSVKDILKLTITFTIAHSITLILASLGLVSLTGKIVEPIIALSIVYMALENIFLLRKKEKNSDEKQLNKRLIVTFLFGLFHGLGFAGALSEIQIPEQFFISALLSFNVGVELGQLTIVFIILLPILYFLKKYSWKGKILQAASLCIVIVALYWFIERVFL